MSSSSTYQPDPILQQFDPLPQPYRMLSHMIDNVFSEIFEAIGDLEKEKLRREAPNAGDQSQSDTNSVHVTRSRNSRLKHQKTVLSHEKLDIPDALCVGVTKAPQTREASGDGNTLGTAPQIQQLSSSERWLITSEANHDVYMMRRNKIMWHAKEQQPSDDEQEALEDISDVRAVAELISVFASVVKDKDDKESIKLWIYHEAEDNSTSMPNSDAAAATDNNGKIGPQLNLLAHIIPNTQEMNMESAKVLRVWLSRDGRYMTVEFSGYSPGETTSREVIQLFKLPSYKKFVGEPLSEQHASKKSNMSVVSGASSSRRSKGGRRIPASTPRSTVSSTTSRRRKAGEESQRPTLRPKIEMAAFNSDSLQEAQKLLHLSKKDFLSSLTSMHTQNTQNSDEQGATNNESAFESLYRPQVLFLSNEHLVKHAATTNTIYRLYNENSIRKSHTKSILVWWKGGNLLKHYDLEPYYMNTKAPLTSSQCKEYTFVDGISCAALSEESEYFALGLLNGNVILFDTKTGSSVHLPESHTSRITALTFTSFGELISGSSNGEVKVFSVHPRNSDHSNIVPDTSSTSSHLLTRIECYKQLEEKILALVSARETNLFWCCTNKHIDILDVNGCALCTIQLDNLTCFKYFGSTGHTFICSSDCLMKEKHGFYVYEALDGVLLAYPEIENQFPSVHNSESAAREVYEFVRSTPHSQRNNVDSINQFLSSPSALLSPLLSRQRSRGGMQSNLISRTTTANTGKRPKSKGVSFGQPSEAAEEPKYISLAQLSKRNTSTMDNPIQRGTQRVEQSKRVRRKRRRAAAANTTS